MLIATDRAWLAGYLEGEGSFMRPFPSWPRGVVLEVSTTDYDIAERCGRMFGTTPTKKRRYGSEQKQAWKVRCRGERAAELMRELRPFMGVRRRSQIQEALDAAV